MSIVALDAVTAKWRGWNKDQNLTHPEASHKYIDLVVVRLRSQICFLGGFGELGRARVVDARIVLVIVHDLEFWAGVFVLVIRSESLGRQ